jgi:Protein of unknown function (DUF1674)
MSHRDPVSQNNGLAKASEDGYLPGAGSGVEPDLVPGAMSGSINGASRNDIALPREIGGRVGPEPTRYGDWEKAGRCIDF